MHPLIAKNQELWDEWAEVNYRSAFYDVAGFKADRSPLDDDVRAGIGDITGLSVLHLQCHFGMDTLRLKLAGASAVTGVDLSPVAIDKARALSAETGIPARFIQSDLYELHNVLDEQFDLVFTTYGVVGWLPDLAPWGTLIGRCLKPGGRFFLIDGHPTMWMFDDEADSELRLRYPYFHSQDPILTAPSAAGNYADPSAVLTKTAYSWPHELAAVVNALIGGGLRLDELREYRHTVWRAFRFQVEETKERFVLPPDRPQIPLMFSVRARRP